MKTKKIQKWRQAVKRYVKYIWNSAKLKRVLEKRRKLFKMTIFTCY